MFSVGLHKPGLGPGPYQGSQRYCDLHLTEDTQVSKSPEGSTSQVLLLINIAKHSKGIWIHFVSVSFFFLLIEIIYFICVQSFLWSVVFLYDCLGGKNDSYCRLYIYEFVNRKKNGIVGILCRNAWFYLLRMKIKAQVKGYMLALLAGSFVGYCMIWFHPVLLPNLTLWYLWQRLGNSSSCRNCAWVKLLKVWLSVK